LILELLLFLSIEAVLAALLALDSPLHVLYVQLGLDLSLVDVALLLTNVEVVLVLLLGGLILRFALIRVNFLDFEI